VADEPKRERLRERLGSPAQRLIVVVAGITTLIGLPLAIKALVDAFWPNDSVKAPRSAALSVGRLQSSTLAQFVHDYRDEVDGAVYTRRQLDTYGAVLPVDVTVTGLSDKDATLSWKVLDANGNAGDYGPPSWVPRTRELRPATSPAHFVLHVWLPPPPKPLDEEIVQFVVKDDAGSELEEDNSPKIQVEPS
jgi:hypothetical protein